MFGGLTMHQRLGNLVTVNFPPTVPEDLVGCDGETSGLADAMKEVLVFKRLRILCGPI